MKIQPVLDYKTPNYPKLDVFSIDPNLLVDTVPINWKNNKIVLAALISIAISSQSCDLLPQKQTTRIELIKNKENKIKNASHQEDSSFVAPIFHHGDGIGFYGCIVIMPPVFITENEAKQIILNEFKKEKLLFDTVTLPKEKIIIKTEKKIWEEIKGDLKVRDTLELNDIVFDGYNKDLNFAYLFLSESDYEKYKDFEPEYSSVSNEDYKKVVEKLRNEIKKQSKLNAVIFYEPIPYPEWQKIKERPNREVWKNKGKKIAIDSLQNQVADFVNWLKAKKIIVK